MRKLIFAVAVLSVLGLARPAAAQSDTKWEVAGGYTYIYSSVSVGGGDTTATVSPSVVGGGDPTEGFNFNGGGGEVEYKFSPALGIVADLGATHTSSHFSDLTVFSYLFGPRISVGSGKYTPFAQALFGGVRGSEFGASQNAFSMFLGGGVDINVTEHFFIRPVEAGYVMTRFSFGGNSNNQNSFRYSAGVGMRF